ncbi:MAG: NAD(P)/FAD-dependent oxidoreductase [Vicinamibacterales bacterium]
MFDVLVVGAGPAGAVASLVLARAGVKVCLIDRASFPRPKLCGDTLNPGAIAVLRRLRVASGVERHARPLEGMRVTGEGVAVDARYPDTLRGYAIRREPFDAWLVSAAVEAGVELRDGVRAREPLMEDDRRGARVAGAGCWSACGRPFDIAARVTIAADGRRSALALALRLTRHPARPRRWAIGVHATGVHGLTSLGEMHIRHGHYIGVAPLPDGLANLCLVRPARSAEDAFRDPVGVLRHALVSEPMLRDRMADVEFVSRPLVLGPLAVERVPRATPPEGLLLAGDAAGFVDPMTGDGLRFALRGGELAAHAALQALDSGWADARATLECATAREFGSKWRFNRALRALVGSSVGVRGATWGARVAPAAIRALIRHAGDCHVDSAT